MLSDSRITEIKKLLKSINFSSKNYALIDKALTHSSYNFENNLSHFEDYERLEFLGDAVLKLAVSRYLFFKFREHTEGQLTKIRGIIVSDEFLAKLAEEINLQKYLNLGTHEEKTGGRKRPSILACAFEALLGALYEDGHLEEIYEFLDNLYEQYVDEINSNMCIYNVKALLQEYTQAQNKDLPEYEVTKEEGKDHNKSYEVTVKYAGEILGVGIGKSKKEAEKDAALNASIKLGLIVEGRCQI